MLHPRRSALLFIQRILALAIILGSVGCSVKQPNPDSTDSRPTPTLNADNGPGDEAAQITFSAYEYERGLYEPLMEAFMAENTSIKVQFVPLPEYTTQEEAESVNWLRMMATTADTTIAWASGLGPEVSTYFRDLGSLLEMDTTLDPDDFWPGALDACADPEGRVMGIPVGLNLYGIFYDEAAFDAARLPYPAPGWTWEDFQKAAAALARQKGDETQYGFADQAFIDQSILGPYLAALIDVSGGELDAAALEPELQWYFALAQQKAIYPLREPEDWNQDWEKWQAMFKSEARPVMWAGSLSEMRPGMDVWTASDDPFSMAAFRMDGFAPFPIDPTHPEIGSSPVFPSCVMISAGSANPRAAWAWANFLTRQPLVRDETQIWERLRLPARMSVAEEMNFWEPLPETARASARFAAEHAWYGSLYPQTLAAVQKAIIAALDRKQSFTAALESARAELATTPQPTPDTQEVVVATPQPPPPPGAAVIEFFDNAYNPQHNDELKELSTAFNQAHPDIFVKLATNFSGPPGNVDWLAYLAEDYDCFSWYTPDFQGSQPESVISLNSFVEAEGPELIQDFSSGQLDGFRYEGELYGLPSASQPQILAYNADLLEKRGLEPPGTDWTFDEFVELISKAASASDAGRSYGFLYSGWETLLLAGSGVRWADLTKDPPQAFFDSPEMIGALTWQLDLVKSKALLIQTNDNWMEIEEAVRSGQVAFWTTQAGQPQGWYFQGEEPKFKIGVAPLPLIENLSETDTIYWSSTQGLFISSQAEDPKACWTWIKYLSEQPHRLMGIPARKSVVDSEAWRALVGAEIADAYRAALTRAHTHAEATTVSQTGWPFYNWRSQALAAAFAGEDPEEALKTAQRKADSYLACIGEVSISTLSAEDLQSEVNACARQADPEGDWPTE